MINRETGSSEMSTEIIDDDADFGQRAQDLKDSLPDLGPDAARVLTLVCNGCGAAPRLDFDEPRLPDGWAASDAGEFCPRCQS